jgi:Ca2+-binding EF-hand superfamily protein
VKNKAEVAFRAYDKDGNGFISPKEMASVSGSKLSREQIKKVFETNDLNGDGRMSQQELEGMMKKSRKKNKN